MLMSFGQFVFGMETLAFQELQRRRQWKHSANARVGARDARQFIGPGDDTFTISGVLAPELTGTLSSLDDLAAMGNTGDAYVLVDGTGTVYGAYLLDALDTTGSHIRQDGTPRKVSFSITLTRQDDSLASPMAQTRAS